jgi:hydroxymethylpyrimidine/phosphomethylpyrimidine kinase
MNPITTLIELKPPVAMTIAGSDSGGGAGIQADLRTFAFHQVHGTSALTCVTAQNTQGVNRVDPLPPAAVAAQISAVVSDIGVQSVKTGMLLNAEIIASVVSQIQSWNLKKIVVDPVMVSRTGAQLIDDQAIDQLRSELLPLAWIVTPNRYEAQILSGQEIHTLEAMKNAAKQIHQLGSQAVLVKGGGMSGELRGTDVWFDGQQHHVLSTPPIETSHTHGTGCTLSAAIAAQLALGSDPWGAVQRAKAYVTEAIRHPVVIGKGQSPIGHFYPLLSTGFRLDKP